jgi:hypothetical protein
LVVGPWLLPGYIFGTDFAGPRLYHFPTAVASYAGVQLALALAGLVLPGDIVGKLLILALLLTAGLTAYMALPIGGFLPRAVASLIYLINPFVYDRLAYGQLNVIGGYAVLPWVASSIRLLLLEPKWQRAIGAASALVILGILDLHMALPAVLLGVAFGVTHAIARRHDRTYLARLVRNGGLTGAMAFVASAYWIVPILARTGPEAIRIAQIGEGDLRAFSTATDPNLGLLPNVLGLYGFWAEQTGRFISMKSFVPIWILLLVVILVLATLGAIATWRGINAIKFEAQRAWVVALVCAAAIATILDIGVSEPHIAPIVRWLDSAFTVYRGMRDANKWAAVLAFAYSQLVPIGVIVLMDRTKHRFIVGPAREIAPAVLVALVLAIPLYYGNGLLYGMHGQIRPSTYPAGWYSADHTLVADPHPGRTVFLPWHGYLALSFVKNTNRVVASPAPLFFSVPVVSSQDLEVPGISPPDDPDQVAVSRLVASGQAADWSVELTKRDFKYILLARELDWNGYAFLNSQPGIAMIADYGSIVLYRNNLWEQGHAQ